MFNIIKDGAKVPTRATQFSAGYDLYALTSGVIPANKYALAGTGISVTCPKNTYGRIAPRSGLALRHGIGVNAGVIDPDYEGELGVILTNMSQTDYNYSAGDKIAQLIFTRFETLDDAEKKPIRNAGGFGSSGY